MDEVTLSFDIGGEMKIPAYIERPLYLNRIEPYMGKGVIKVLVGQRRVGKSYMLFQLMDRITTVNPDVQVLYINKELHEFAAISSSEDLLSYVKNHRIRDRRLVLLIDEIQDIQDFERALRSLSAGGETEIICTGSNAVLLSGELATLLSGRYVEIKVYSLNYGEFLQFHELERTREAFSSYLRFGGLPYLRNLPLDEEIVFEYLRNILDAILLKDVVGRYQIRNVDFLQRLALFLADNIGSLVSARRISAFLKSQKVKVSHNLVLDYLSHLCTAFLVFKVRRSDIFGRKIFEVGEKYYYEDLGIRNALIGYRITDINKILENVVFMHLKMAGYDVHVGQLGSREVDFVCDRHGERMYVQVAYMIPDDKVRDREFGNLLAIPDNFPKFVVSMDEPVGVSYHGIRHIHAEEFLHSLSSSALPIVQASP